MLVIDLQEVAKNSNASPGYPSLSFPQRWYLVQLWDDTKAGKLYWYDSARETQSDVGFTRFYTISFVFPCSLIQCIDLYDSDAFNIIFIFPNCWTEV